MGRRGRKRQLEVEARYWQLLQTVVGTVEACRQVGITRKTGYWWRAGPTRLVRDSSVASPIGFGQVERLEDAGG
jgi:hypothetical protein